MGSRKVTLVFLVSRAHIEHLYPGHPGLISWGMAPGWVKKYLADPRILSLEFSTNSESW